MILSDFSGCVIYERAGSTNHRCAEVARACMIDGSIAPRQAWFSQKGKDMANGIHAWWPAAWLTVVLLAFATGPASAANLRAGEYACAGSSGILIGIGFILNADSTYTDLDRKTCLLYTSDAADEEDSVDLGGRRI